jgi:hypothetical protein
MQGRVGALVGAAVVAFMVALIPSVVPAQVQRPTLPAGVQVPPLERRDLLQGQCTVLGLKKVALTSESFKFLVQYTIPTTWPGAFRITAAVPSLANRNSVISSSYAGQPNGVPKGEQIFPAESLVELTFNGSVPVTTESIEWAIVNAAGTPVCSASMPMHLEWAPTCHIDGIQEIKINGWTVKMNVQYSIPTQWTGNYYVGGYIPSLAAANSMFHYAPAAPPGIPKGQHQFTEQVGFTLIQYGANVVSTSGIEVFIYPEGGKPACSSVLNWQHTWSGVPQ